MLARNLHGGLADRAHAAIAACRRPGNRRAHWR
jgi:hypothetical protein